MQTYGTYAGQETVHIVFLFLNALFLVLFKVKVLSLGLRVPKLLKVHLSVLLHLYFVLFALVFEAVVYFSRHSHPQTKGG